MKEKIKWAAIVIATIILATLFVRFQPFGVNSVSEVSTVRVACVGDSITELSNYTTDLQLLLGANYSVGNFGVSGSTVSLSSYKPYMYQPQFQLAQEDEPNIVVIMLGTNDAHSDLEQYNESFEDDYNTLVNSFQNLDSQPQVLVVESPPVFNNSLDLNSTFFSNTVIPHIQNVANYQNVPTVDVYDAFGNQANYTVDGVHPNSDGAELIASQVYDTINQQDDSSSVTSAP